jgi:predicted  nucleic acid-binding Zn-ribbon protein
VSVDWFLKLKEIASVSKMWAGFQQQGLEHEGRLSNLNDRRREAHARTVKLRQDVVAASAAIADVEARLRIAAEQKQRLLELGSDEKRIAAFTAEIGGLEERGLELLGQLDDSERELGEAREFVIGLDKTIAEISAEVAEERARITVELRNLELRRSLLLEELPGDFRTVLEKTTAKNLAQGPFTRVENGSCYLCRYKISRIDESEIDTQKNLKTCPQCSRIFLPYGS